MFSQETLLIQNIQQHCERGNISNKQLEPWLSYLAMCLRAPGAKAWWGENSFFFDQGFVALVNQHIKKDQSKPNLLEAADFFRGTDST